MERREASREQAREEEECTGSEPRKELDFHQNTMDPNVNRIERGNLGLERGSNQDVCASNNGN